MPSSAMSATSPISVARIRQGRNTLACIRLRSRMTPGVTRTLRYIPVSRTEQQLDSANEQIVLLWSLQLNNLA